MVDIVGASSGCQLADAFAFPSLLLLVARGNCVLKPIKKRGGEEMRELSTLEEAVGYTL